jgi:hypothetical protein
MRRRAPKWVVKILAVGCLLAFVACQEQPPETPQTESKAPDSGVTVVRVGDDKNDGNKIDPDWELGTTPPTPKSSASTY